MATRASSKNELIRASSVKRQISFPPVADTTLDFPLLGATIVYNKAKILSIDKAVEYLPRSYMELTKP